MIAATLRALAFLTRLPPVGSAFEGEHRLGDDAPAFPLAGLVAALPSAVLLVAASAIGLSPLVAAILATALLVAVTGALHEDGLADVADGLGGHHAKARALAIMKDSRIGAYGTLALILALALRIGLLAELTDRSPLGAASILLASAAASRGAMAWIWSSLPSADPRGLADRMGQPSSCAGRRAALIGILILAGPALVLGGPFGGVLPLLLGTLALGQVRKLLQTRLGGQTGDGLGACQQIVDLAILLGFAIAFALRA
ncbi:MULTISPECIES: adenosylcobinamide-GDP ribazoletransferase [unclassified Aureimonas]|uniref:adenosylcobinamide-GDP ribazoletransferase n=1 Tax=unclassified Aureimonas TaxID=2615206 RepID=UPI0006F3FBC5|nr:MULTISPECIES: adenosylcobinamide-GDP ribazoletransferase [unclassified Aureimonas]KQT64109.1 hypothetical protein ASG62_03640 [Aureimonas sp. Leaf427]KQT81298.1 hypothetical protein ASG54_00910 [Aureimonas sp. Leaf460]